jgi:hypothetical protein
VPATYSILISEIFLGSIFGGISQNVWKTISRSINMVGHWPHMTAQPQANEEMLLFSFMLAVSYELLYGGPARQRLLFNLHEIENIHRLSQHYFSFTIGVVVCETYLAFP